RRLPTCSVLEPLRPSRLCDFALKLRNRRAEGSRAVGPRADGDVGVPRASGSFSFLILVLQVRAEWGEVRDGFDATANQLPGPPSTSSWMLWPLYCSEAT